MINVEEVHKRDTYCLYEAYREQMQRIGHMAPGWFDLTPFQQDVWSRIAVSAERIFGS